MDVMISVSTIFWFFTANKSPTESLTASSSVASSVGPCYAGPRMVARKGEYAQLRRPATGTFPPPRKAGSRGRPSRPEVREALDKVRAAHTTQSPAKLAVPGTSEGVERT